MDDRQLIKQLVRALEESELDNRRLAAERDTAMQQLTQQRFRNDRLLKRIHHVKRAAERTTEGEESCTTNLECFGQSARPSAT